MHQSPAVKAFHLLLFAAMLTFSGLVFFGYASGLAPGPPFCTFKLGLLVTLLMLCVMTPSMRAKDNRRRKALN